jgi:hypothetical protein
MFFWCCWKLAPPPTHPSPPHQLLKQKWLALFPSLASLFWAREGFPCTVYVQCTLVSRRVLEEPIPMTAKNSFFLILVLSLLDSLCLAFFFVRGFSTKLWFPPIIRVPNKRLAWPKPSSSAYYKSLGWWENPGWKSFIPDLGPLFSTGLFYWSEQTSSLF